MALFSERQHVAWDPVWPASSIMRLPAKQPGSLAIRCQNSIFELVTMKTRCFFRFFLELLFWRPWVLKCSVYRVSEIGESADIYENEAVDVFIVTRPGVQHFIWDLLQETFYLGRSCLHPGQGAWWPM